MNREEISYLISAAREMNLPLFEIEREGAILKIRFEPTASTARTLPAENQKLTAPVAKAVVRAPQMGVFSVEHPMSGTQASDEDRTVEEGQTIGFLRIREAVVAIKAPSNGTIRLVSGDDQIVGYNDVLYTYI